MRPVARAFVEVHFRETRSIDVRIPGHAFAFENVFFEKAADGRALGKPERPPCADELGSPAENVSSDAT
jgi:hypothetical protein